MTTCKINGVDMYETYGLILASKEIEPPKPQTKYVEVVGRNGSIDMTEAVTNSVRYKNRTISLKFLYLGGYGEQVASDVYKFLHGKRLSLIFGDDANYYYEGRISCKKLSTLRHGETITVTVDADPFKYDILHSTVDWEWDTFDFEDGIINDLGQLVVSGELEVILVCRQNAELPTITCSAPMNLVYDGVTYNLSQGDNKVYRLIFLEGYNTLKFVGNGTVSIDYVGGLL